MRITKLTEIKFLILLQRNLLQIKLNGNLKKTKKKLKVKDKDKIIYLRIVHLIKQAVQLKSN